MNKPHELKFSDTEKEFIEDVKFKYAIEFSFQHNHGAPYAIEHHEKVLSGNVYLKSLRPSLNFKKWDNDSLKNFTIKINNDYQKIMNYKRTYDSLTYIYENNDGNLLLNNKFKFVVK